MTDTKRPLATNNPGSGSDLVDLSYDARTDVAVATYKDGTTVQFPDCSRYQYGFCLIVNENSETKGGFDVAFANMDDEDVELFAIMTRAQRDDVLDNPTPEIHERVASAIALSFALVGIPATFRRMDHWIVPHLQLLNYAELKCMTPHQIGLDMIERFQGTDYAFRNSRLLLGR